MEYIGEHLLPGKIGHFFLLLSFVASLLAAIAYFFATQRRETSEAKIWKNIGRISFTFHGLSVFIVIGMIFYIMTNHYYEYHYVWEHVSEDLPMKYIFSAFWEGQEGSFLLWMFWHVVLGFVLMFTSKSWESPILSTLALVQLFISSMILGVYFGFGEEEIRLGSNPFVLLRDELQAPIFASADYLQQIKGNGMNPLLQNYWMTIHPPTLFLGFASTVVPFCFAIAALWTGRHKEWIKPVMPWASFSAAILGIGVLMGAAWAYEALSFGGYWAWDPVENTSLVPWLVLIAGVHTNLIARNTNHSIKSTYIFYLLAFLMVVYSTFLTRSGILGDTSVHAFTEMGLENQLVLFIFTFVFLSVFLYFKNRSKIPSPQKEEAGSSKEFWMFIGALVLIFSAILITVSTSLPVYNKIAELFNPGHEAITIQDQEEHNNKYQLWIAVLISLLSGFAQFLRFKEFNWKKHLSKFSKHASISILIAGALTFLITFWIKVVAWQYLLLLFSGIFAIVANTDYIILFLKGNLKIASASFAHIGFGLMVVGIIASGLNKKHISTNPFAQRGLLSEDMLSSNVLLMKGVPMFMSGYNVTYMSDTLEGNLRKFRVNFKKENSDENFDVYPSATYNNQVTKVAAYNPSTKRYLDKDIFTLFVLPRTEADVEEKRKYEDSLDYELYQAFVNDTIYTKKNHYVVIKGINFDPSNKDYIKKEGDLAVGVKLSVHKPEADTSWLLEPIVMVRGNLLFSYPAIIPELSMRIHVSELIFDRFFEKDDLDYNDFVLKEGDQFSYNGMNISFNGFNTAPTHPAYFSEEGDIAVSAILKVTSSEKDETLEAQPIYLIRNNQPFNLKDQIDELGLHFRFLEIDPNNKTVKISVATSDQKDAKIPIEIAEDALRSDYIVLEAIIFPGINLFWLGTILMMFGFSMSMWNRRKGYLKG
jgi:cytochrome c-type biogenesis protein CcmF